MKDYTKNSFWVIKNEHGVAEYYIKIDGVMVPVSEEVYKICKYSYAKTVRDNKRAVNKILSLDKVNADNHGLYDYLKIKNEEDEVLKLIRDRIETLEQPIQIVLIKYFYESKTIREIANEIHTSKSTVYNRLKKGVIILRNYIKNLDK